MNNCNYDPNYVVPSKKSDPREHYFRMNPASRWDFDSYCNSPLNNKRTKKKLINRYKQELQDIRQHASTPESIKEYAGVLLQELLSDEPEEKLTFIVLNYGQVIIGDVKERGRVTQIQGSPSKRDNEEFDVHQQRRSARIRLIQSDSVVKRPTAEGSGNRQNMPKSNPAMVKKLIVSGNDVSSMFNTYKLQAARQAKSSGLCLETDTQKILSLSHILLLKPCQNEPDALNLFGENCLKEMHSKHLQKHIDKSIKLDADTRLKLLNIAEGVKDGMLNKREADDALRKLSHLLENDLGFRALQMFNNRMCKLPLHPQEEDIEPLQLITQFLDPIVSVMFQKTESDRRFKWSECTIKDNVITGCTVPPAFGVWASSDSSMSGIMGSRQVRSEAYEFDQVILSNDLIRMGLLCQETLYGNSVEGTLGLHVAEQHLTFFLCALEAEEMFILLEIGRITVPASLEELPQLVLDLDTIMRVMCAYKKSCIKK